MKTITTNSAIYSVLNSDNSIPYSLNCQYALKTYAWYECTSKEVYDKRNNSSILGNIFIFFISISVLFFVMIPWIIRMLDSFISNLKE